MEVEIKRFGVSEVYADDEPEVDICFVHGLCGHPRDTWTGRKTKTFWPSELLPKDLRRKKVNVRILVYGYNANVFAFGGDNGASSDRIINHAQTMVQSLYANRAREDTEERPLVFVCHSLGGIIVKKALQHSKSITDPKTSHLRSIFVSTAGIIFLGTPHLGTDNAKMAKMLRDIASVVIPKKVLDTEPQLVDALQSNSETLQNINTDFIQFQNELLIYFFHETLKTVMGLTRDYVVDEPSAAPSAPGAEYAGIEANHSEMCKFDTKNSPGYDLVAEAIQRYAGEKARATVKSRWEVDRKMLDDIWLSKARSTYPVFGGFSNENYRPAPGPAPGPTLPNGTLRTLPPPKFGYVFEGVEEYDTEMAEA